MSTEMRSATVSGSVSQERRQETSVRRIARTALLVSQGFIGLTAIAGGGVLIVGSLVPAMATAFSPPEDYLRSAPFVSYLIPGLILALVVGGLHVAAFFLTLRRRGGWRFVSAAAGFALLIWIFVQMIFIPFSFLQAIYFIAGLIELGLVMLTLGIVEPDRSAGEAHHG